MHILDQSQQQVSITGSTNPENLRQIFQVKLLLECDGKWGPQFIAPHNMLTTAEQVTGHATSSRDASSVPGSPPQDSAFLVSKRMNKNERGGLG